MGLHQLAGGLSNSQYQYRLQGVLRSSLELPSLVDANAQVRLQPAALRLFTITE